MGFLRDSFWNRVKSTKNFGALEGSIWVESFIGLKERKELRKRDVDSVA